MSGEQSDIGRGFGGVITVVVLVGAAIVIGGLWLLAGAA